VSSESVAGSDQPAMGVTAVTIRFSEPVDPASIRSGTIRLLRDDTGAEIRHAAGSPRLDTDGRSVTVQPFRPFRQGYAYRLVIPRGRAGPRSLSGRVPVTSRWTIPLTPVP